MSLPTIILDSKCIKRVLLAFAIVSALAVQATAWEIDLSRRRKESSPKNTDTPRQLSGEANFFSGLFSQGIPSGEIVILNTDKGFVPQTVRVKKGAKYTFHVVNVNEKEKNVSFILDAFSQYVGTYYGKVKSFEVEPKKDGVFSYQCPETSFEGRLVVLPDVTQPARALSSEEK